MTNVSRRFFIGGLASCGAFGGCRFFRAPAGTFASGKPNLKFGVVSDIHVNRVGAGERAAEWGNTLTFIHTLEWFRDQGVDAVLIAGDMADRGLVSELEAVAQAWFAVFPDDRAPDGRKVEKLFVTGNHDWEGWRYGAATKQMLDKLGDAERAKAVLANDYKGNWERIFREEYSPVFRKNVNGYDFVGAHWFGSNCRGKMERGVAPGMGDFIAANAPKFDPARPFFYFQHPHPKDTCYGAWAWGRDDGRSTNALSPFSNAIAFSGHSHYSLTDERSVWQGAFTSVGTSSLRYTGMPYDSRPQNTYENTGGGKDHANKTTPNLANPQDCRQGMLWSIYADRIVVRRREFLSDLDVGDDWVLPLPSAESKPFAFADRAKKSVPPAFPVGAKLVAEKTTAKTRGAKGKPSEKKPAWKLTIPNACASATRALEFEVVAEGAGGKTATFNVLAEGFNHSPKHPRAWKPTVCTIACDRMPADLARFAVRPLDSWWNKGAPLVATVA